MIPTAKVQKNSDIAGVFYTFYILFNAIYSLFSINISNFVSKNKI